MSAALLTRLAALEKEIKVIKTEIAKESKEPKKKSEKKKPTKIDECNTAEQVKAFKVVELKAWLAKNKVEVKNLEDKYKDDLVKIVWKNIKKVKITEPDEESDEEEPSEDEEEESAGEGYEWYYY
jgi:hypothetical protein